ncbi:DUF2510 domain-containing protein [Streptomyces sp. E11-3]|uniref:DUF2510 domain-containing protein n=1 Tax=Streptomyces sp. E11-3 TaxID=3110112 RepID=UPI00398093A9
MSMTTPPGWYPDPSVPSLERWWDGTTWTEHTRDPQAAAQQPAQQQPGFGPPQPVGMPETGGTSGRAKMVALAAAGVVLVAAIVTGVVVLGKSDDGGAEAKNGGGTSSAPASESADPRPSEEPTDEPSESPSATEDTPDRLVDQLNGISLPIPDGWEIPQYSWGGTDPNIWTKETYDCPTGLYCHHGRVISLSADSGSGDTAREVAEKDVSDAAEALYGDGYLSDRYGGVTSTKKVKAGPVVVAGRTGYVVRVRVKTGEGPGGYVQSLVFPSAIGTESLVVVRFAFDAGPDGLPLSGMDEITKGIRDLGSDDAGTGGAGSSISPS